MHGENVISGGGDQVKRTGSEEEWFVRVNDSCLDTPTAQSPNLTWFSLDAAECLNQKLGIVASYGHYKLCNNKG